MMVGFDTDTVSQGMKSLVDTRKWPDQLMTEMGLSKTREQTRLFPGVERRRGLEATLRSEKVAKPTSWSWYSLVSKPIFLKLFCTVHWIWSWTDSYQFAWRSYQYFKKKKKSYRKESIQYVALFNQIYLPLLNFPNQWVHILRNKS